MRRRHFIALATAAVANWPLLSRAQQKPAPVIGILGSTAAGPYATFVAAFHQGLSETGYVEGQNLRTEFRWAEGHYDRLPALARKIHRSA